jgi:pimeloyl-ACP methyl ester carboxylesterase
LWGSKDKLVSRRVIDALEKALPQAESFVHIGGGHHLQEDEPDWVAEKVTSFFLRDTH